MRVKSLQHCQAGVNGQAGVGTWLHTGRCGCQTTCDLTCAAYTLNIAERISGDSRQGPSLIIDPATSERQRMGAGSRGGNNYRAKAGADKHRSAPPPQVLS